MRLRTWCGFACPWHAPTIRETAHGANGDPGRLRRCGPLMSPPAVPDRRLEDYAEYFLLSLVNVARQPRGSLASSCIMLGAVVLCGRLVAVSQFTQGCGITNCATLAIGDVFSHGCVF